MNTWFNTQERIDALEDAAASWVGTPFVANSRVKGPRGGVSCQMLAAQLYTESGFPLPFAVPAASMRWSRVSRVSQIAEFIEANGGFQPVADLTLTTIQPGDLLGFKIGGCVHHMGVALTDGRFIHTMRKVGTRIYRLADPTYCNRMEHVWRPVV